MEPGAEVSGTVSPRSFDVGTVGGDSLCPMRQKAGLTGGEHCHSRDWGIYFQRGQGRHYVVLACIYSSAGVSSARLKIRFQQISALWIQTFHIKCGQPGRDRWGPGSCLFVVYPLSHQLEDTLCSRSNCWGFLIKKKRNTTAQKHLELFIPLYMAAL